MFQNSSIFYHEAHEGLEEGFLHNLHYLHGNISTGSKYSSIAPNNNIFCIYHITVMNELNFIFRI